MKTKTIKWIFTLFVALSSGIAFCKESANSYSGLLDEKFSVRISASTLKESVSELIDQISKRYPWASDIHFEYDNAANTAATASDVLTVKDMKLGELFDQLCARTGNRVRYDFVRNRVMFEASNGSGPDPKRTFYVSKKTSEEMKLDWKNIEAFAVSLFRFGVVANVIKIDEKQRVFVLSGRDLDLDHVDYLIVIYGRLKSEIKTPRLSPLE